MRSLLREPARGLARGAREGAAPLAPRGPRRRARGGRLPRPPAHRGRSAPAPGLPGALPPRGEGGAPRDRLHQRHARHGPDRRALRGVPPRLRGDHALRDDARDLRAGHARARLFRPLPGRHPPAPLPRRAPEAQDHGPLLERPRGGGDAPLRGGAGGGLPARQPAQPAGGLRGQPQPRAAGGPGAGGGPRPRRSRPPRGVRELVPGSGGRGSLSVGGGLHLRGGADGVHRRSLREAAALPALAPGVVRPRAGELRARMARVPARRPLAAVAVGRGLPPLQPAARVRELPGRGGDGAGRRGGAGRPVLRDHAPSRPRPSRRRVRSPAGRYVLPGPGRARRTSRSRSRRGAARSTSGAADRAVTPSHPSSSSSRPGDGRVFRLADRGSSPVHLPPPGRRIHPRRAVTPPAPRPRRLRTSCVRSSRAGGPTWSSPSWKSRFPSRRATGRLFDSGGIWRAYRHRGGLLYTFRPRRARERPRAASSWTRSAAEGRSSFLRRR